MNVKQLTYTSGERGWEIERINGIPTEKEKKVFSSIIAQRPDDAILYAYDYSDGVSIFSRSVPHGTDVLGRRRFYAHGYVFSGKDCDEIFSRFSDMLSINYFADCETAPLKPVKEVITEFSLGLRAEKDTLVKLVAAVYETVFHNSLLEIRTTTTERELFITTLINTVFEYIPNGLRKFVSFASAPGGTIHKITATDTFSGYADIKYVYDSGEFEGLGTKYLKLAELLLSKRKESVLEELDEILEGKYFEDISSFKDAFTKKTDDIVFYSETERKITSDEVPAIFGKLMERGRFNNPDDINYFLKLFPIIKKDEKLISSVSDESAAIIYKETQSEELKNEITGFLVSKHKEDENPFYELLPLKDIDINLMTALAEEFTASKNGSYINGCALYMLENPSFILFAESCSKPCADCIYSALAQNILKSENKTDVLTTLYAEGGKNIYILVEKALIANGDGDSVLDFYTEVLSLKCISTQELENLKDKLELLNLPTQKYVEKTLHAYAGFVFSEGEGLSEKELIKKITVFSGDVSADGIPEVINIKESYWKQFDFAEYDFSDDFKTMSVPANGRSLAANSILNFSEYLKGLSSKVKPEDSEVIKKIFLTSDKTLSKKEKHILIKKFKKIAIASVYENIETALLLCYSPKKNTLKLKRNKIEEDKLIKAIKNAKKNEKSVINTYTVSKSLYRHFKKLDKPEGKSSYDSVQEILKDIMKNTSPLKEKFLSYINSFKNSPYPWLTALTVICCIIVFMITNRSIYSVFITDTTCMGECISFIQSIKNKTLTLMEFILYSLLIILAVIFIMVF